MRLIMPVSFPGTPGFDIAGEVVEIGPGVTDFAPGARVHARIREMKGGASAEYAVAGVDVTAPLPAGMDPGEAAGLPLAGMTALQGLRDRAGLPLTGARERVLVVGASGGVGHLAVQIRAGRRRHGGRRLQRPQRRPGGEPRRPRGARLHEARSLPRGRRPSTSSSDCVAGDPGPWLPLLGPGGRYASTAPVVRDVPCAAG